MPVELFRYEQERPSNTNIRELLIQQGEFKADYLYLVATYGQFDIRSKLNPRQDNQNLDQRCFVFREYIKLLLQSVPVCYLSRPEERIRLKRAMTAVRNIPIDIARLQHDVFTWINALAECAEREIDLRLPLFPPYNTQVVNRTVADLLEQLNGQMRTICAQEKCETLAISIVNYLRSGAFNPPSLVIMEGFTFLTPLQNLFIDACLKQDVTVRFLIPYRQSQSQGFEVMERTYSRYGGVVAMQAFAASETVSETSSALSQLQVSLFSDTNVLEDYDASATTLREFAHQSDEVKVCISEIQKLLTQGASADQIAIVTRDPGAFHSRLQEEAQFQQLPAQLPIPLGIPPRHLLLTPLGRFALLLYQVYTDNELNITADQFEAMMASGWLGIKFQGTVEAFQAVRPQFFVRTKTRQDWIDALSTLESVRTKLSDRQQLISSRMPAASVTQNCIDLWIIGIDRIERLCQRIFSAGEQSINDHVRILLSELRTLDPNDVRVYERELLERIQQALNELENSTSIAVTPGEFGEVLSSMVTEYGKTSTEVEEDAGPIANTVWVTTPEGIDCCSRDYIFYLGVDSKRVPRSSPDPWPFYRNEVSYYQERERYLFLAVVRAAKKNLVISYSKIDEDGTYTASPYIGQIERISQLPIISMFPRQIESIGAPESRSQTIRPVRREKYTLTEIAIFGLCPFRYKLERLSQNSRRYRTDFTTQTYAGSVWTERIYNYLTDQDIEFSSSEAAWSAIRSAIWITESDVRRTFPSLRAGSWFTLQKYIERDLRGTIDFIDKQCNGMFLCKFKDLRINREYRSASYIINTVSGPQAEITVNDINFAVSYMNDLSREIPLNSDIVRSEWLLPPKSRGSNVNLPDNLESAPFVFGSYARAFDWWDSANRACFHFIRSPNKVSTKRTYNQIKTDLIRITSVIETSSYPKHPGEHCGQCPSRPECLGIDD